MIIQIDGYVSNEEELPIWLSLIILDRGDMLVDVNGSNSINGKGLPLNRVFTFAGLSRAI